MILLGFWCAYIYMYIVLLCVQTELLSCYCWLAGWPRPYRLDRSKSRAGWCGVVAETAAAVAAVREAEAMAAII